MSAEGTRVVLVKPGDVLVFGNVGHLDLARGPDLFRDLKEALGLSQIVVFEADIDMAGWTEAQEGAPEDGGGGSGPLGAPGVAPSATEAVRSAQRAGNEEGA